VGLISTERSQSMQIANSDLTELGSSFSTPLENHGVFTCLSEVGDSQIVDFLAFLL